MQTYIHVSLSCVYTVSNKLMHVIVVFICRLFVLVFVWFIVSFAFDQVNVP